VDFKNPIIVMTSNLGSAELLAMSEEGQSDSVIRERVLKILKHSLRPELLNRIDETVVFHQLTREQLSSIIAIQIRLLRSRLDARGLTLNITAEALEALGDEGYDPQFGARPLKRVIQRRLENPIATGILSGEYEQGDTIKVHEKDGELVFLKAASAK
nr:AAA family ATPase [Planctomycetota bacterium]